MTMIQNQYKRFDVQGIDDPGKNDKVKTKGIAGYGQGKLCKIIGWIMEKIFHKWVLVQTENGKIYLNCKSFVNWYARIPHNHFSKEKVQKLSHDPKFVQQAIADLVALTTRPVEELQDLEPTSRNEDELRVTQQVEELDEPIIELKTGLSEEEQQVANEIASKNGVSPELTEEYLHPETTEERKQEILELMRKELEGSSSS